MSISAASPSGSCTSPTSTPRRPSIDRGGRARGRAATRFGGPKQRSSSRRCWSVSRSPVDEVVVVARRPRARRGRKPASSSAPTGSAGRAPRCAVASPRFRPSRSRGRCPRRRPNLAPQAVERVLAAWREGARRRRRGRLRREPRPSPPPGPGGLGRHPRRRHAGASGHSRPLRRPWDSRRRRHCR